MVTSANHLEIPLMMAERAWAYAMQRKQETADAPYRVRRHVVTRLAKAAKVIYNRVKLDCITQWSDGGRERVTVPRG